MATRNEIKAFIFLEAPLGANTRVTLAMAVNANELQHDADVVGPQMALDCYLDDVSVTQHDPLTVLDLPLADVYGDYGSITGRGIPEAGTPDEAVFLPGRNVLLTIKAVLVPDAPHRCLPPSGWGPHHFATGQLIAF